MIHVHATEGLSCRGTDSTTVARDFCAEASEQCRMRHARGVAGGCRGILIIIIVIIIIIIIVIIIIIIFMMIIIVTIIITTIMDYYHYHYYHDTIRERRRRASRGDAEAGQPRPPSGTCVCDVRGACSSERHARSVKCACLSCSVRLYIIGIGTL